MKKVLIGLLAILMIGGVAAADQTEPARNKIRTEKAVTTNTVYTTTYEGTLWIQTDSLIYINTAGTTPNIGYEGLGAGQSRSYWPIPFAAGSTIKMTAASGTANVTIYNYDR